METCTRRLQFAAGHRVYGHENKCANLHGHNYVVFIHARPLTSLDNLGRVVDFSILKARFGQWIEEHWDHGFLYFQHDREVKSLFAMESFNHLKSFACDFNPTAEEMAKYLLAIAPALMTTTDVEVFRIVVHETENCSAEASLATKNTLATATSTGLAGTVDSPRR